MDVDSGALLLSRIQFAWVIALHILLPAFTVGLSCYVATLELLSWLTQRDVYRRLSAFWLKVFAVSFGMGVVSGIVMPFQFGTNWSRFTDAAANVFGPLMGYEVLTAFFLESAFLGVLLFGRKLVPQWVHVMAAVFVALGTLLSSFWILAVNSWMQTPAGVTLVDGRFVPTDLWAMIFSPSLPYRLVHTVLAFVVTTGFVVLATGAYYLRHGRAIEESRVMVKMSLFFLIVTVPAQMVAGDAHGLNTLKHQPVKIAAMEGLWETQSRVPANLFSFPDQAEERNHFEISIPVLGSLYLTHDPNGVVRGLKDFPPEDRPPVAIVFWAFHLMVGLALLMLLVVVIGLVLHVRKRLFDCPRYWALCTRVGPIGFVTVLCGWVTTEVGRQPWTVYGMLRTAHSVTPSLTAQDVMLSLALYVVGYLFIFGSGLILLARLIRVGPDGAPYEDTPGVATPGLARPSRPLSAAKPSLKKTENPPHA
ncbi:cytochrome bd ubiquinol oxidase subunit I [Pararobbsia alpina]|uniref:cytochrome ubiquinol oxidase subunit I n=1 Tax=Pararobbsia alpina TaxID=621374 RepID=UPI0039A4AE6B